MEVPNKPSKRAFRLPISLRLTLWYGLSMLVLLGLFSGLLLTSYHWNQHSLLHQRLFKAQAELLPEIDLNESIPRLDPALARREGALRMDAPFGTYVRLLSPEGDVWEQSANFEKVAAFRPMPPAEPQIKERDVDWQQQGFRVMYAPVEREGQLVGWLEVSGQARQIQHQLAGRPVAITMLITVMLALLGGYALARHALRPVVRLTEAANQIHASALNIRLPIDTHLHDELTDLAETFNTMLARLEASFEREGRFTANAAHELLNPLAAVQNEAEVILRRPRTPVEYQQTLRTILTDVKRLGKLVEQLLDLARVEAGSEQQSAAVDLVAICQQQRALWEDRAAHGKITLRCETPQQMAVAAHPVHLETILDNLLENAFKYTPPGGWVQVRITKEDHRVYLAIADSGVGFEPDLAERLFDRFYRADTPDVQAHPGNGLGLAIVQAIVRSYGGTLSATSEGPGRGSVFSVQLPVINAD